VIAADDVVDHAATGPAEADLSAWVAGELGALGWRVDGLYLATSNAGHAESVEFWRAARDTGLAFANPRRFPWTLANSPTGAIAKALDVHGPTYTLVGGRDAVAGALEHAADDLADGVVTAAVVVAVDLVESVPAVVAVLLSSAEGAHRLADAMDADVVGRPVAILSELLSG
jgi:hypothetical protein